MKVAKMFLGVVGFVGVLAVGTAGLVERVGPAEIGVRQSCSPVNRAVGVVTLPTRARGDRSQ